MDFNTQLIKQQSSQRLVIAFDPSYLSKSGRHTPGIGYSWLGCANSNKSELEICGIAAIDLDNHTGMCLQAIQTFKRAEPDFAGVTIIGLLSPVKMSCRRYPKW